MIISNSPFGPQIGVAHGHSDSPPAHGKPADAGVTGTPAESRGAVQAPRAAQADNNLGGGGAKSSESPAGQARALLDAQTALDAQQAKVPFGHIVRLFAQGDADAAASLFATEEPDDPGSEAPSETVAVPSTEEPDADGEDIAVTTDMPPIDPEEGEDDEIALAPELDGGDVLADLLDDLLDEQADEDAEQA